MRKIMECWECKSEFTHKWAYHAIDDICICPDCGSKQVEYTFEQQILNALADGRLFDFVCKHGHNMRKETLITLAKELAYGIETAKAFDDKEDIKAVVIESLEENLIYYDGAEDDNE